MQGNESFAFILPMTSLNGGLISAVQRDQAVPALFCASLLDPDFSPAQGSLLNVFNSPRLQASSPTGPPLVSLP